MMLAPVLMLTDPMPSPPVPTMSTTAGRASMAGGRYKIIFNKDKHGSPQYLWMHHGLHASQEQNVVPDD
jgi:hypothetical protein